MRRTSLLVALLVAAGVILAGVAPASAAVPQKRVTLIGANESPRGDRDGRGEFSWSLNGRQLCYLLTVRGIRTAAAAHIHRGARGANGAVVVPLTAPANGGAAACATLTAALATAIRTRPGRYYVNVHNAQFPAGALRAQLR